MGKYLYGAGGMSGTRSFIGGAPVIGEAGK